jgi:site-specific recombinase XerC
VPTDPLQGLIHYADDHGLTAVDMHHAADIKAQGTPTLGQAVAQLNPGVLARIAKTAPQGLRTLLEGQPGEAELDLDPIPGLGDRPYIDLALPVLETMRDDYQQLVAARGRKRTATGKVKARAGAGSRDGSGAAAQLVSAARAVAAALVDQGLFANHPLLQLRAPKRPGALREKGLTEAEVREYCLIVLSASADPVLAALAWMLFRVLGTRLKELLALREIDLTVARPSVTLVGKGGAVRERPLHRPLAMMVAEVMGARPAAKGGQLLRTTSGTAFSVKDVERWSTWLHHSADWALGFPVRVHTLRHTAGHEVVSHGQDATAAGLWLGHAGPSRMRTTVIYTGSSTPLSAWEDCVAIAESSFGSLEGWPVLAENDYLSAVLDVDLPLPASGGRATS